MDNGRLQEIKKGDWLLHGTEEWTNQRDTDTEAVILELIAAYETSQQELAEAKAKIIKWEDNYKNWENERSRHSALVDVLRKQLAEAQAEVAYIKSFPGNYGLNKVNTDLRSQLAASQAEVERLEKLYNSDRANYLDDITLLQTEVEGLRKAIDLFGDQPPDCSQYWELGK